MVAQLASRGPLGPKEDSLRQASLSNQSQKLKIRVVDACERRAGDLTYDKVLSHVSPYISEHH